MTSAWEHLGCCPTSHMWHWRQCPWAKPSCVAPEEDAGHPTWCGLEEHTWAGVMGDLISSDKCKPLQWRCTLGQHTTENHVQIKTVIWTLCPKGWRGQRNHCMPSGISLSSDYRGKFCCLCCPPAYISCPAFLLQSSQRKLPGYNQDIFQVTLTVMWRSWGCFLPSFF